MAASQQLLTALFSSTTLSGTSRLAGVAGEVDRCPLFWRLMLKEQITADRPDELLYIIMLSSSLPRYSQLSANAVCISVATQGACVQMELNHNCYHIDTTWIPCSEETTQMTKNSNQLNNINEQVN